MKAAAYNLFKKTVENVRPPISQSQFKEKGVLTPDEFVLAGEYLVQTCPTWAWEGGDANKRWSFLPAEKQYLITRNVPCLQRASSLLTYAQTVDPSTVGEDVEEGEWLTTATPSAAAATDPDSFEFEMLPAAPHPVGGIPDIGDTDTEQEFTLNPADIPDISSLTLKNEENQQENEEDDDAVAPSPSLPPPQTSSGTAAAAAVPTLPYSSTTTTSASPSGVLQTRTYDLLISYDNYYHVPRVWLIGYGEDHNPLTQSEVLDDVISDYFSHRDRKTVSVEDHPHRGAAGKVVSIHPCRHAEVMKKLSEMVVVRNTASGVDGDDGDGDDGDNGSGSNEAVVDFKVEHYMVLFLKFISSVVPTIEYDYTMPVGL